MLSRIASAAVGLPLLALVIWIGSPWFSMLAALAAAIGALELCNMARQQGGRPVALLAAGSAAALVGVAHILSSGSPVPTALGAVFATGAMMSLAWLLWRSHPGVGLADWGFTVAASIYTGGLLAYAPLLRGIEQGRGWVFLLAVVTFTGDTSAFLVGRSFGKHPLASRTSPGKTWEGAVGGLLGAIGASLASAFIFDLDVELGLVLVLGGLMGIAGQVGDLTESRLKRAAGVKESGWLIPGHGGVLDRLDSIVFNLVLVYYFVLWAVQ